MQEKRKYNALMQLTESDALRVSDSQRLLRLTLGYGGAGDNNGNVITRYTETGTQPFGQEYRYDAVNRLRIAVEGTGFNPALLQTATCAQVTPTPTWCERYAYDAFGNVWNPERMGSVAAGLLPVTPDSYLPEGTNVVTNRLKRFTHDNAGHQTEMIDGDVNRMATYDAEGRLAGIALSGNLKQETYTYDGDGRRVKRVVGPLTQPETPTTVTTWYVYGVDGQLVAEHQKNGTTESGTAYLLTDHLGSTRAKFDGTNQVTARWDYEPFGGELQRSGDGYGSVTRLAQRFTAKERDAETGLDWMKTRYFSGAQGRFTSPDKPFADQFPEDPQSWNLYSYVRNNPLKMVDEDGQSATLVGAIGGGIIGGAVAAWRGESVWKGASSGAVAGALAGAVIDTGGVALGVYGAAAAGGALGGVGGGVVSRALNGQETTVQDVAVDAALGAAGGVAGAAAAGKAVVAVGQRIAGPSAVLETLRPGLYASESVPATGPRVIPAQAQQLRGEPCHTCGTTPGTRSGNPVADHQPSTGLVVRGNSQRLYPHCTSCSGRQGSQVRQQNQTGRGQQTTGGQAGAGAGTAGTRRPEDEHN